MQCARILTDPKRLQKDLKSSRAEVAELKMRLTQMEEATAQG
jgi:hypothetical protein